MNCIGIQLQEGEIKMSEHQVDELITWLYILFAGLGFMTIVFVLVILTSLVIYIKTGVHIREWIEEKFPTE